MKRILSLILVLMLIMSLAVTAFAAEGDENTSVTLTIRGENTNHRYVAYQIFSGRVSNTHVITDVEWGSNIAKNASGTALILAALKADGYVIPNPADPSVERSFATIFAGAATAEDVAKLMATWGDKQARIQHFAELLNTKENGNFQYLTGTPVVATPIANGTDYQFTLAPGYYLIMDEAGSVSSTSHDFYTNLIVSLTSKMEVRIKGTVPTVSKQVSQMLESGYTEYISDQTNLLNYFELDGKLPNNFDEYDAYKYVFEDTLSSGLTFNRIEEIYILSGDNHKTYLYREDQNPEDNQDDSIKNHAGKPDVWSLPAAGSKGGTVQIGWENLYANNALSLSATDHIIVRYSATMNDSAVIGGQGNTNSVKLIYSNNPNGSNTGTTIPDVSRVYTFALQVTKIDGATSTQTNPTKLAGAEFQLFHKHGDTNMYAIVDSRTGDIVDWTANANWTNALLKENEQDVLTDDEKALTTKLVTGENGIITFNGIKYDMDYYLRETAAPPTFNSLDRDIQVQITSYEVNTTNPDDYGKVTKIVYEADNAQYIISDATVAVNGVVMMTVENKSGDTLPSTGGMGTTILYIAGSVLVLAAVVLLITKKRMADAE